MLWRGSFAVLRCPEPDVVNERGECLPRVHRVEQQPVLSFIGLGVQPPNPELGTMMSEAREALQQAPHAIAFPGLVLMLIVLGFNLLGMACAMRSIRAMSVRSLSSAAA